VFFVPDLSPYSGNWSTSAVEVVSEVSLSQLSAFAVRAPDQHMIGYFLTTDAGGVLRSSRVKPGSIIEDPTLLACGSGTLSASAQWNGQAIMLAASSSRTPLGCTMDSGLGVLPQHLTVTSISLDGSTVQVLHDSVMAGDAVAFVDLQLHDSGAWVVYQYMGLSAEVQPPVMVMRLDASGGVKAGPLPVVEGYLMFGEIAVARMGNRLAIAWFEPATQGLGPRIQIRVLNEDGSVAAPYTIAGGDGHPNGRLSLISSKEGDKLLVAWSVEPMGGGMLDITWLARLDCGLP